MLDRIKGEVVFHCDGDGEDACTESLETGERDFMDAKRELDAEGWKTFKKASGNWGHRCPDCSRAWLQHNRGGGRYDS